MSDFDNQAGLPVPARGMCGKQAPPRFLTARLGPHDPLAGGRARYPAAPGADALSQLRRRPAAWLLLCGHTPRGRTKGIHLFPGFRKGSPGTHGSPSRFSAQPGQAARTRAGVGGLEAQANDLTHAFVGGGVRMLAGPQDAP